jgi:hypothetical protein
MQSQYMGIQGVTLGCNISLPLALKGEVKK